MSQTITPRRAANAIANALRAEHRAPAEVLPSGREIAAYEPRVTVYGKAEAHERGYHADAVILWEEGPYEWALDVSANAPYEDMGVFIEPYNSFILCFYRDNA